MPTPGVVSRIRSIIDSRRFRGRYSQHVVTSISRLVNHQDVLPVWEGLERDRDPYLPELFLDACSHALWQWERLPKVPDGEMAELLSRLARDARSLADRLDQHAGEIAFCGVSLVVEDYMEHLSAPKSVTSRQQDESEAVSSSAPVESQPQSEDSDAVAADGVDTNDPDDEDDMPLPVPVSMLLRQLARRLTQRYGSDLALLRPTKPRAASAERTFLVRSVAHFFLTHGGDAHWDWVARCVSAMTDTSDLDGSHASKLFEDLRPVCWESAEDYRPTDNE